MLITVNDKPYDLHIGYQKEETLRKAFNHLVEKTFPFSYESWYQAGYWNDNYIPYTLFDKERALASVSVNIMHFEVLGQLKRYIQLCAVMTDEAYRGRGLSRYLMEFVLEQWKGKCDLIYLYADNTVLDMYRKFGFKPNKEYLFFNPILKTDRHLSHQKLDMDNSKDRAMLYNYAKNTKVFAKLSLRDTVHLTMFYCLSFLKNNIFYVQTLDVIVVATFNDNQACLWDVFSPKQLELETVMTFFSEFGSDYVQFGFTPLYTSSYSIQEIVSEHTLLTYNDARSPFDENELRFPLLTLA